MLDVASGLAADQSRTSRWLRASARRRSGAPRGSRAGCLPSGSSETTPVGIFSRTVSIRMRRRSSSCTACCRLLREFVDLPAAVGQLRGHVVEGAHQRSQFILGLHLHAGFEVAGGDFVRGLGQRLDRDGDLLGEKEREPGGRKKQQDGEQRSVSSIWFLKLRICCCSMRRRSLAINRAIALQKIGRKPMGDNQEAGAQGARAARKYPVRVSQSSAPPARVRANSAWDRARTRRPGAAGRLDIALGVERPDALRAFSAARCAAASKTCRHQRFARLLLGGGLRHVAWRAPRGGRIPRVHFAHQGVGFGVASSRERGNQRLSVRFISA